MSSLHSQPKILAIIPCFQEERNLPIILADLQKHVGNRVDILVVDDGSMDNTARIAIEHGIRTIVLPVNLGIGGAMQAGFKFAVENGYDYAFQFDADGQHRAEYLPALLAAAIRNDADIIIGSRFVDGTPGYKVPGIMRIGMIFFSKITTWITGQVVHDTSSGLRCLNRKVLIYFSRRYPTDFPDAEALLEAHFQGFTCIELPVAMGPRIHGVSSLNFKKKLYYPFRMLLGISSLILSYWKQVRLWPESK